MIFDPLRWRICTCLNIIIFIQPLCLLLFQSLSIGVSSSFPLSRGRSSTVYTFGTLSPNHRVEELASSSQTKSELVAGDPDETQRILSRSETGPGGCLLLSYHARNVEQLQR
mmetsp:Transcript_31941/g.76274  ORF Transcript_31941/g.76274 Transcript_31941/m.76274 type:complete len:112 (+) Transcript_31941:205-540(+)